MEESSPRAASLVNSASSAQALYLKSRCRVSCILCLLRITARRGFQGAFARRADLRQNTSDYSYFALALAALENGPRTAHKTQENRGSGAIASDGRRVG